MRPINSITKKKTFTQPKIHDFLNQMTPRSITFSSQTPTRELLRTNLSELNRNACQTLIAEVKTKHPKCIDVFNKVIDKVIQCNNSLGRTKRDGQIKTVLYDISDKLSDIGTTNFLRQQHFLLTIISLDNDNWSSLKKCVANFEVTDTPANRPGQLNNS